MLSLVMIITFPFLYQKYPFLANSVRNIKIACLNWKSISRVIPMWWNRRWCPIFLLYTRNIFFPEILSKNLKLIVSGEICYFQNFEYAGFDDAVNFSCFRPGIPFSGRFCLKIKTVCICWTCVTERNCNLLNLLVLFIFSVLNQKHWFKKSKLSV